MLVKQIACIHCTLHLLHSHGHNHSPRHTEQTCQITALYSHSAKLKFIHIWLTTHCQAQNTPCSATTLLPQMHPLTHVVEDNITVENFSIVGWEEENLARSIKEAIFIRVNDQSLNRSIERYHLPHIWDEVLVSTSELKCK